MSDEERARAAAQAIIDFAPIRQKAGCEPFHVDQMTAIIADAIRAAVTMEREAFLDVIEKMATGQPGECDRIVEAIRQRAQS